MATETPFLSGTLLKLGGGAYQRLQPRTFQLYKGSCTLVYHEESSGSKTSEKGSIDLTTAVIADRGTYIDNKLCFTVEGVNTVKNTRKMYFLFAENKETKWRWINALMLVSPTYAHCSPLEEDPEANWKRIRHAKVVQSQLPSPEEVAAEGRGAKRGNGFCCDCEAPVPTWGVVLGTNNSAILGGCFVCIDCVGVHRAMWPDKCLEVEMDSWSTKQIDKMSMGGNTKVNEELQAVYNEANLEGGQCRRPNCYSSPEVRAAFIRAKYFVDPASGKLVGKFSKQAAASNTSGNQPFSGIPKDPATREARVALLMSQTPPRYCGLLGITVESAVALPSSSAPLSALFESPETLIVCFTNGYQEVSTMGGVAQSSGGGGCEWNQEIHIGTDAPTRPIYGTLWCCGASGPLAGNGGASATDGTSKRILVGTIEIIPSAIMAAANSGNAPPPLQLGQGQLSYRTALPINLPPIISTPQDGSATTPGSSEGVKNIAAGIAKIGNFLKSKSGGGKNALATGSEGQLEVGHISIGLVFNRMA